VLSQSFIAFGLVLVVVVVVVVAVVVMQLLFCRECPLFAIAIASRRRGGVVGKDRGKSAGGRGGGSGAEVGGGASAWRE